jgi:hypothetical protein
MTPAELQAYPWFQERLLPLREWLEFVLRRSKSADALAQKTGGETQELLASVRPGHRGKKESHRLAKKVTAP